MSGMNRRIKRGLSKRPTGKLDQFNEESIEGGRWLHPTKGWRTRSPKAVVNSMLTHDERVRQLHQTLMGIRTAS